MRLLIATTNSGKLREVTAILEGLAVDIATLTDFPGVRPAVEDGETFLENARRKAMYYAAHTGHWTLADDSGLEVDALGGAPGVLSARYAGEGADDQDNNARLMAQLAGVPQTLRTARFRCAMVLASPTGILATAEGMLEGVIVDPPRGANGFGYDPHFYVEPFKMTSAEMPPELKNTVSHRAQALQALRPQLEWLLARGFSPGGLTA